jgi:sulfate/thiosulfate transport system substrate-binding protein
MHKSLWNTGRPSQTLGIAVKSTVKLLAATLLLTSLGASAADKAELLNASYDVSRELFVQINPAFQKSWQAKKNQELQILQSHGGSSRQARAVAEGLKADVVTFNQATDIDFLAKSGLVAKDWAKKFPNGASPYYSLPIFLVRDGNPKGIKDWDDLAKANVKAVFPNPKTSGNGRYTYLSAYAYALGKNNGNKEAANKFVAAVLANVPVFDTGGRGATTTFVEREIGDVLVTFESEVIAIRNEYSKSRLDVVYPSESVRVDFPVAVVDKVVLQKGTRELATAYLNFLYTEEAQEILAQKYNRVRSEKVAQKYAAQFPALKLVAVEELFGGWDKVTAEHFGSDGILDKLLAEKR